MKVIKKINNNVALCIDGNGKELIAFGKGIGFLTMPYELNDLNLIQRTFYDIDKRYFELIEHLPIDMLEIAVHIVDYARCKIQEELNPNIAFTLADHIQFSIARYEKKMEILFVQGYELEYLYENEFEVGRYAIKYINQKLGINLKPREANGIALHFINAEMSCRRNSSGISTEEMINWITEIIERCFEISINRNGFNFSRFASHIDYLLQRGKRGEILSSENVNLYNQLKDDFYKTSQCADEVANFIYKKLNYFLSDEEKMYLILHINRLCSKEEPN